MENSLNGTGGSSDMLELFMGKNRNLSPQSIYSPRIPFFRAGVKQEMGIYVIISSKPILHESDGITTADVEGDQEQGAHD